MAKHKKTRPARPARPKARLPRGFVDRTAGEIRAGDAMLAAIREVFERYGFDPLETPLFEYTDALGKFLPDQERPNAGVFSLTDDDEQWLSLRYDLTAPLARHVAQNLQHTPLPFRTYRCGPVFRNEKPGPGRFRQFLQFDADTVGAPGVQADAEMCMMMADTMEALGIARGDYVIRVNNRKVLDGVMEAIGLRGEENAGRRLGVLRAIDKLDRLGIDGVEQLLGKGRKDESGDFTKGVGLGADVIAILLSDLELRPSKGNPDTYPASQLHADGWGELFKIEEIVTACGYERDRIRIDPCVVRGLEYYTGPVYEAELTFPVVNEKGETVQFGSVGGGGRYDDLVMRFTGQSVPATGFSIGVSRLMAALKNLGKLEADTTTAPVLVTVMDGDGEAMGRYQRFTQDLRAAGIRAEMYQGNWKKFGNQLKYADRRGSPVAIIQGADERGRGEVLIKDLIEGKRMAQKIADNKAWREARPAQVSVPEGDLVGATRAILARHSTTAASKDKGVFDDERR